MRKADQNAVTVTIETPGGLNSQTSKCEEVSVLALITDRVRGTQTYLDSLFTDELVAFFADKVQSDFCPNIMAEYYAELENNRNLTHDLQSARTSIDLLNKDKDDLKTLAKHEIEKRDKVIEEKNALLNVRQIALAEACMQKNEFMRERDSLAEQVKSLKVMLFDLQNKVAA